MIYIFLCRCVGNENMVNGENYMQGHKKKSFRLRQRFYFFYKLICAIQDKLV